MATDNTAKFREKIEEQMGKLVLFNIHHISHLFVKKGNRELAKSGFSLMMEQLPVLFVVNASDELCSQQDIANILQKDKSGIQRSIQTLARDGYLRITADTNDRRRNLIELTPAGKVVIDKVTDSARATDKLVTDFLEPEELATLIRLLKKVATIIEP